MTTLNERRGFSKRILDLCFLVGAALLLCVVAMGAFAITEVRHISPMWVFLSGISLVFFVWVREEYRKEFRSVRFVFFVCGWLLINLGVVVVVLGSLGWFYLMVALFLEQVLFYMTAYWLFGSRPPFGRGKQS